MSSGNNAFVVKNGLIVNTNLIYANNGLVGINNTTPDAALTVTGNANVQGNVVITQTTNTGNVFTTGSINVSANVVATNVYANALVGNVFSITVTSTSNVITGNVYATNVNGNTFGIHTGNVSANIVSVTGNVVTTNLYATTVNASANIYAPIVYANIAAITITSTSNVLTQTLYGNVVGSTVTANTFGVHSGNVSATVVNASANVSLGSISASTNGVLLTNSSIQIGNTSVYVNVNPGTITTTGLANLASINTTANVYVGGSETIAGNLTVAGQYINVVGNLYVQGSFNTVAAATVNGNIVPVITGAYSLGNTTNLFSNLYVNSITVGGLVVNSTGYSGTANNTNFVGATSAANVVSNTQLAANLAWYVNTSASYTLNGVISHNGNVVFNSTSLIKANGAIGTIGQVLTTNSTGGVYWNTPAVSFQGNGINISTGSIAVVANSGLVSNVSGVFLNANSGIIANSFGTFVNTTYIVTQNPTYGQYSNATNGYQTSGPVNTTGQITTSFGPNSIQLTNVTSNWIDFGQSGFASPTTTTTSVGTKLRLWAGISTSSVDYALGVGPNFLWYSVPYLVMSHQWYANTTNFMSANSTYLNHIGTIQANVIYGGNSSSSLSGVIGVSNNNYGVAGYTNSGGAGVSGTTNNGGVGILGVANGSTAIAAYANSGTALYVQSNTGPLGVFTNGSVTSLLVNSLGSFVTGTINSSNTISIGATFTANLSGLYHTNYLQVPTISSNNISIFGNTGGFFTQSQIYSNYGPNSFFLANGTSNWITWLNVGLGPPGLGTPSAGTKLMLWNNSNIGGFADYAIGLNSGGQMWFSLANNSLGKFSWYGGTTEMFQGNSIGFYHQSLIQAPYITATTSISGGSTAGIVAGVQGNSNTNYGVYGNSNTNYGVYGLSNTNCGISGLSLATHGVYGLTACTSGYGVYGQGTTGSGGGTFGYSWGGFGAVGQSNSGTGVFGTSNVAAGVLGTSISSHGVYGNSTSGYGGFFNSSSGFGAYTQSISNAPFVASNGTNQVFYVGQNYVNSFVNTNITGNLTATQNITAYYSDEKLKTRLENVENALDKICSMDGFYYEANELAQSLGYEKKREIGISAQQTQKLFPEIVAPAPIDPDKYLTVHYDRFVPILIEAIKELKAEIDSIKKGLK